MSERWRRELAQVEKISPDPERIRARARRPSQLAVRAGSTARTGYTRSRLAAAVIAILIFVLAISMFVVPALLSSGGEPAPTRTSHSPTSFVPGAPKADALAEANKLIDLTQVPPGSRRASASPSQALRYPNGVISCATEPCDTAIDVAAWWSMPLPMDEAVSWLQEHPPAGLFLNGDTGSGADAAGRTTSVAWTYQDHPGRAYTIAELRLSVAPDGAARSVLRADGALLWVPPRTDKEEVPESVDQVRLSMLRGSHVVARKVLNGVAAQELAGLLNHLGRINMGRPRCPFNAQKAVHYTMSFPHHDGAFVFTEWSCSSGLVVFAQVGGHPQPALSDQTDTPLGSTDTVLRFLECHLGQDPKVCPYIGAPSATPAPDPQEVFCTSLRQLEGWFSADVAEANGDEGKLAEEVKGQLGGVMMWFHPNEQAITDPGARAAADTIVIDALALQTWPAADGSFHDLLEAFSGDSASFTSTYCS